MQYPFRPSDGFTELNGCILFEDADFINQSLPPEILAQLMGEERAWIESIPEQMAVLERRAEVAEQRAELGEQRIAALESLVSELTARLNQDSTNSHKPPSSD